MPDLIDLITEQQDAILEKRLANARNQTTKRLAPRGSCYFCKEPINDRIFCDVDCAEDYERDQRQQRMKI